jgi:hypothetical protein
VRPNFRLDGSLNSMSTTRGNKVIYVHLKLSTLSFHDFNTILLKALSDYANYKGETVSLSGVRVYEDYYICVYLLLKLAD